MVEGKRRLAFPGGFGPVSYNGNSVVMSGKEMVWDGVRLEGTWRGLRWRECLWEGFGKVGRLEDQHGKRKIPGSECCPWKECG